MVNYYVPTEKEFIDGLEIELFDEDEKMWLNHTLNIDSARLLLPELKKENVRVKYLNSFDFVPLGYRIEKVKVASEIIIVDIIPGGGKDGEDKEVFEDRDVFDEENLIIFKGSVKMGIYHPMPHTHKKKQYNLILQGKRILVKNKSELIKILK